MRARQIPRLQIERRTDPRRMCELFSRPDVTDNSGQPGDEPGRLDPPDRFDRAMSFAGGCLRPTRGLQARLPFEDLSREGLLGLEDLTDLKDSAVEGCPLEPLDGLIYRAHFPQPVPAH